MSPAPGPPPAPLPAASARMFCTFRLAGRRFGVDVLDVKEISEQTTFTPVAHAPDAVLGLVNIRGHIDLALDLARLLGLPATAVGPDSRLVRFKPAAGAGFGVVVDEIGPIQAVPAGGVEPFAAPDPDAGPAPAPAGDRGALIEGVCPLDGELLVVLHARRFLAALDGGPAAIPPISPP